MNTEQKREALKGVYPAEKWVKKVEKMSEAQVVATYLRLKGQRKV